MATRASKATLEQKLIQHGVDISAPDFQQRLNEHMAAAMNAVPMPVNPANENIPERFKSMSASLHAFGRLGTMLQVVLISGGLGPLINLGLIVTDTVRLHGAIFFEHNELIKWLLSIVFIFSYTYLSFVKADLKYLLRKNERERFSIRRLRESVRYWWGAGHDWQPRKVTPTEIELERISGFYFYFKAGIFVLLFMAAIVTVLDDMAARPDRLAEHIFGAVGSVIMTMLLLSALDMQIGRSLKSYMQTDGGQSMSMDFFEMEWQRYLERRSAAAEESVWAFLALEVRNAQMASKALPSHSTPLIAPILVSPNGNHPTEEALN